MLVNLYFNNSSMLITKQEIIAIILKINKSQTKSILSRIMCKIKHACELHLQYACIIKDHYMQHART